LAVSAYSEKGLLKKNPLLGTSLAVDKTRGSEREKFGNLHAKAMDFQGTKEEFQTSQQGEYDARRDEGLAAFATSKSALETSQADVTSRRTKIRELQNQGAQAKEMSDLINSGNWKKMTAFEKNNPEIAKLAQEYWDAGGKKKELGSYRKGKRSEGMKEKYAALTGQIEEQQNILNMELPGTLKELAAAQSKLGSAGGENKSAKGEQAEDVALSIQNSMGGALANTFGQGLMDWQAWGDNPGKNALSMVGADPFMKFAGGDIMGGFKDIAMNAFDPGNLVNVGKAIFGKSAKKAKRKANRRRNAAGKQMAYMDELGLQQATSQLGIMQNQLGLATASTKAAGQQQTVNQQRKTLEDQANFYSSFFS
jgi:hypothetical protein